MQPRFGEQLPLRVQAEFLHGNRSDPGLCQRTGHEAQSFRGSAADDDVGRPGPYTANAGQILSKSATKLRAPLRVAIPEGLERCTAQRTLDRTTPLRPRKRRQIR